MQNESYFVKPNVRIQGLVDQYCASLHSFAPVPAALNLAKLYLPMLDSFVADPKVHSDALASPSMRGSFFIDIDVGRVGEVRALRDRIRADNEATLRFAAAIERAEEMLAEAATGYGMSALYARLPAELRGLVELVYDLDNHAQLRFMEAMLYLSPYFRAERQSIDLSVDDGSEPPFALSTPRLPDAGHLQLPLRLSHPGTDAFFGIREKPRPLADIQDMLNVEDSQVPQLMTLLTPDPTPVGGRSIAAGGRIRYFGHACLLVQSPEVTIMTDPFVSSNPAPGDRFTYLDLPDHIDYVLLTHGHQDHVVLETLLHLRGLAGQVIVPRSGSGHRQDPSLRLFLEQVGFTVREVDDFDELPIPGGVIVATPFIGEHGDLDIRAKSTYWINVAGKRIFVGADSSGLDPEVYGYIRRVVGRTDLGFIGMECDGAPMTWIYSSLFRKPVPRKIAVSRKLSGSDAAQAADIVEKLGITHAFVYAMGLEDWLQHIMAITYNPDSYQLRQVAKFLAHCKDRGVRAEQLMVRREICW